MKAAMKAGDPVKLATLRLVISEIKKREIDKRSALDAAEVQKALSSMIKQRSDSIEAFEKAGRQDLADKEKAEQEKAEQEQTEERNKGKTVKPSKRQTGFVTQPRKKSDPQLPMMFILSSGEITPFLLTLREDSDLPVLVQELKAEFSIPLERGEVRNGR